MKKFWCGFALLFLCILSVPALSVKADAANKGTESEQGYTGWKTKKGEKYYYLDGVMQKKWQVIQGKKYYFNKKGMMLTGWQKINTKWYQFSKKGVYLGRTRKKTIVLDPGHSARMTGGTEPLGPGSSQQKAKDVTGTQGIATNVAEYKLTLVIAKKVEKELESRGYRVLMTRTTNRKAISCKERAMVANRAGADAFIRIHANGSGDLGVHGAMTICTTGNSPYVSKSLSQKSKKLSSALLDAYVKATGARKEYVWETDSMSGNNWSKVPAAIIEMGYMTNPTEDRRMQTAIYQKRMVKGIANGIDEYFR